MTRVLFCWQWFVLLALLAGPVWAADDEQGFKPLFDGKSLEGWDGNPEFWSVRDGAITGQTTPEKPTKGNTFVIWRGGDVADFELRLQFRIEGGNSGIQYRSHEIPNSKWVIGGYQADFDGGNAWTGTLYEERGRGILAKRGQKVEIASGEKPQVVGETTPENKIVAAVKQGEWNDYTVIAKGNHLIHKVNGLVTVDVVDHDQSKGAAQGLLALQLHAGPPMTVQFKNIRIKKLDAGKQEGKQGENDSKQSAKKKVVFLAGGPSHGFGAHDHLAGCKLLAAALEKSTGYETVVHYKDWPHDLAAYEGADCVVMYSDGGANHPVNRMLDVMDQVAQRGTGIVCLHYAVEVPQGESGDKFLNWIGGYFETHWSVNPHWVARFAKFPEHPITRGVKPFEIDDEWYYHMRFRPEMQDVTPILSALPPKSTLTRPDGPHSGNPHVREAVAKGEQQHVAWAAERGNNGRGFGFTGGHNHWNWGDENFRKIVLNAIVWCAHGEVPQSGVGEERVTLEDLLKNPDEKVPENFDKQKVKEKFNLSGPGKRPAAKSTSQAAPQPAPATGSGAAGRDAADAVASLDVAEGLQATLFASEPEISNITSIDIDHLGRVWACEVKNYRKWSGSRPEGDRILVLDDANGDGKCDNTTVFYQGRDIDSAHGVCVLGDRVIVSALDKVLVLFDDNGDLKADRQETLFSGIGGAQHDHGIHAFTFGPDGKLYFNFGNEGKQLQDKNGKPVVDLAGNEVKVGRQPYQEGMVFRCNLDGSDVETLGWNFRNNWEVAVDSFGTLWQSDNDDDGNKGVRINYVMEFGNYGYKDELTGAGWKQSRENLEAEIPLQHWHLNDPGVVPNLLQTGAGSPTGICMYEGTLLPKQFHNQIIHCDAGPSVCRAYITSKAGAGYKAEIVNVLYGARDNWYRPSDACVAPDGSLFIADWYDPGVGGHNQQEVDKGRIYRVAPSGVAYKPPKPDFDTVAGAVAALKSPANATRYLAYAALKKRIQAADAAAIDAVTKAWRTGDNPRFRARALALLATSLKNPHELLREAAGDKNPDIRIAAVRLLSQVYRPILDQAGNDQSHNVAVQHEILAKLVKDSDPAVRRQVAIAIRQLPVAYQAPLWAELAAQHDGKDRWYLEALGIGAGNHWDACLAAYLKQMNGNWNTPAGRDIVWRSRAKQTPALLAQILLDEKTTEEDQPRYLRAFDFLTGPERDEALKQLLQ